MKNEFFINLISELIQNCPSIESCFPKIESFEKAFLSGQITPKGPASEYYLKKIQSNEFSETSNFFRQLAFKEIYAFYATQSLKGIWDAIDDIPESDEE